VTLLVIFFLNFSSCTAFALLAGLALRT